MRRRTFVFFLFPTGLFLLWHFFRKKKWKFFFDFLLFEFPTIFFDEKGFSNFVHHYFQNLGWFFSWTTPMFRFLQGSFFSFSWGGKLSDIVDPLENSFVLLNALPFLPSHPLATFFLFSTPCTYLIQSYQRNNEKYSFLLPYFFIESYNSFLFYFCFNICFLYQKNQTINTCKKKRWYLYIDKNISFFKTIERVQ